jgi:signal peptidase I
MCESNIKSLEGLKRGDLVTYRRPKDIGSTSHSTNGIGIIITIHENFVKVYWLYAKNYLWIGKDKLIVFTELTASGSVNH